MQTHQGNSLRNNYILHCFFYINCTRYSTASVILSNLCFTLPVLVPPKKIDPNEAEVKGILHFFLEIGSFYHSPRVKQLSFTVFECIQMIFFFDI